VLLPVLINREALKVDVASGSKLRLHRSRDVNRTLHSQLLHAILHDGELDSDDACHFNCTTEGDLAVALRKVQVAHAELGTLDMYRQKHFAATRQVLDIAVSAVPTAVY
jgi:hypothetical protein